MLSDKELKQFVSLYLELVKQARGLEVRPVRVERRASVRRRRVTRGVVRRRGPGRPRNEEVRNEVR